MRSTALLCLVLALALVSGCRSRTSARPPQPTATVPQPTMTVTAPEPTATVPVPAPAVQVVGVPEELAGGAGLQFAVTATHLDPAHEYLVKTAYSRDLGRRADCVRLERSSTLLSAVFSGTPSHTQRLTLYGCNAGTGTITARLWRVIDGEEQETSLSVSRTAAVTITADAPAIVTEYNPFAESLPATAAVTLPVVEFAALPNSDGQPARMMLLSDEPGTGRLFVNDMRGPLYSLSYDGGTVLAYLDLSAPHWALELDYTLAHKGFQSFAFHPQFNQAGTPGYGRLYTLIDSHDIAPPADFRGCRCTQQPDDTVILDCASITGSQLSSAGCMQPHDTVLLEWTANEPAAAVYDGGPPREVLRIQQPYPRHNGGMLAFRPEATPGDSDFGLLYISVGDGGANGDPLKVARDLASVLGKILRIDPLGTDSASGRYGIPADNPFVGQPPRLPEIYASGLRNPQRFAWDAATGRMFVADIGQDVVEKISPVTPGADLGWSTCEGSFRHNQETRPRSVIPDDRCNEAGVVYPFVEYDQQDRLFTEHPNRVGHSSARYPDSAITGVVVYRHSTIPALEDKLLFGDFPSGEVLFVPADKPSVEEGGGGYTPGDIGRVLFMHEGQTTTLLSLIQAKNRAQQAEKIASRADLRFGTGPEGMLFLLNKRDGTIRRVTAVPE